MPLVLETEWVKKREHFGSHFTALMSGALETQTSVRNQLHYRASRRSELEREREREINDPDRLKTI